MNSRALLGALLASCSACGAIDLCHGMKIGEPASKYELSSQTSRTIDLKSDTNSRNDFFLGPGLDIACCLTADAGTATCGTVTCSDRVVTEGVTRKLAKPEVISDGTVGCGMWTLDGKIQAAWTINSF